MDGLHVPVDLLLHHAQLFGIPGPVFLYGCCPQVFVALHATDFDAPVLLVRDLGNVPVTPHAKLPSMYALLELVPDHMQ
jgi:hypothetical protein